MLGHAGRGDADSPMVPVSLWTSVARKDFHGNRGLLPLSTSVRFLNFLPVLLRGRP